MNANPFDLSSLLDSLPNVRAGVIGDFCLDVYWEMDNSAAEESIETGLMTRPVRRQRYSLGGAGAVVNNLLALGAGAVEVFGVVGDDPFGREMQRLFAQKGVGQAGLHTQAQDWDTPVYVKPLQGSAEENRIDFGNFNRLHDEAAAALLAGLEAALPALDVVLVNQQLLRGIHSAFFQAALNDLMARRSDVIFVADCRHLTGAYPHCIHRMNEAEASRLCGAPVESGQALPGESVQEMAAQLFARWQRPVFVSRGARGALVADAGGVTAIPGLHIIHPVDPVGAGDSMLAGIALALAAGCSPVQAATFSNFVAGVTVQKLFQTGTASPAEVRAIGADPDYVYAPELADDPRKARYWQGGEIEVITPLVAQPRITHAIFDHDGTVSVMRQGWEEVMEPVMVRAILGDQYERVDKAFLAGVVRAVHDFIDKTTGIQTLVQMQGLVRLVREFGLIPAAEVLDAAGYKRIYLEALSGQVNARLAKLRRKELDPGDFTVRQAPAFLQRLFEAGVQLYLASGSDVQDVVAEAEALGYAPLFQGRIYGAVGDVAVEAKRMVLERILNDIGDGNMARVATFGDGPVEIREARKRGGVAIGIASDEVRRYGLNLNKRSRLVRAGAHLIAPDYTQMDALLELLGIR